MLIFVINKELKKKKEDFGEVKRSFLFITNFCYKVYIRFVRLKKKLHESERFHKPFSTKERIATKIFCRVILIEGVQTHLHDA